MSKSLSELDKVLFNKEILIITCDEQIEEIDNVLNRDKFSKYFTQSKIKEIKEFIRLASNNVTRLTNIKVCRDPADDYLLSLAIDYNASYLISGDKDLLVLKQIGNTQIITYKELILKLYTPR